MAYSIQERMFAVKQHLKSGRSLRQSAKALQVSRHALTQWVDEYNAGKYNIRQKMRSNDITLDFEISPLKYTGYHWSLWNQNLDEEGVELRQRICSFQVLFKQTGETICKSLLDYPNYKEDPTDDSALCSEIASIVNKADSVMGHNMDKFDIKHLRTRMFANGLPPLKPIKTADTLKEAKSLFKYPSNKLAHLIREIDEARKMKLQLRPILISIVEGTAKKEDIKEFMQYGLTDVICSDKLENAIAPWSNGRINQALFRDGEEPMCPCCGSENIHPVEGQYKYIGRTSKQQLYLCDDCGYWATDGVNLIKKAEKGVTLR